MNNYIKQIYNNINEVVISELHHIAQHFLSRNLIENFSTKLTAS